MELNETPDYTVINKVFFIGSKKLGYSILKKLHSVDEESICKIITIDDTKDNRSSYNKFQNFATKNKISIDVLNNPSELSTIINEEKPELIIVSGWYWIIPTEVLNKVPNGLIGLHASLLPQYRGFAPLVWAVINGEKKTGISLFYLSDGVDTGDIIDQRELIIDNNCTIDTLLSKVEKMSLDMVDTNYKKILNKTNNRISQSKNNVSYCSIRRPEDGLINWGDDNISIHNFIRSQSDPYPGAFTHIKDKKYYILESVIINETHYGPKGLISRVDNNSIIVCCGKNALKIVNIRSEDSKENIINKMRFGTKFESIG